MTKKHSYKDLFMGAVVGGTLGAMTALLFGTKGGKHIQKSLKNTMHKLNLRQHLPKLASIKMIKNKIQSTLKAGLKGKILGKKVKATSGKRKHHA